MKKLIFLLGFTVVIAACSSKNDNGNDNSGKANFDRTTLLTNWADNIILPSYENYQTKVNLLQTATTAFTTAPTIDNLVAERTAWVEAYKAFQKVAIFNFGKASDVDLIDSGNTYPADTKGIESNVASGTYDFSHENQFALEGFPGLDYMLNGLGTDDATIVTFYITNDNATKYKKYLTDLVAKLKTDIDAVVTDWKTGGYRDTYVKNNGTSVTSAVNITTNLFVNNLEKAIRSGKIGIPAGKFSEDVLPKSVEAYYKNDISKELLKVAVQASQDFFNGKNFNSDATGPSLKSTLDYLKAVRDGKNLSDVINTQYATIFTANDALSNSFSEQIKNDNTKMLKLYNVLQKNVLYTKLDMMQALNMTIDYADSDGD